MMTPFQEFRLWARRSPVGERAAAAVASALVLTVLVWVLIPSSPTDSDALTTGFDGSTGVTTDEGAVADGSAPGDGTGDTLPDGSGPGTGGATTGGDGSAAGGTVSGPAGGAPDTGSAPAGAGTGSAPGGGDSAPAAGTGTGTKACPSGSAKGVSDKRLKIAIILVEIAGPAANSVFGIPSKEIQREHWDKVVKDVNASGGAGCRQIVPTYYSGNPADRNSLQRLCLEIAESDVFAVLDTGAYAAFPIVDCYPRNKVPYFGAYLLSETLVDRSFPYLFEFNTLDRLHQDTVFALRDRGFYKDGFQKLAFPYKSCDPNVIKKMRGWFGQAGISSAQIVEYDFGCPNGLSSPSDLQQAVLSFQRAGATHLTYANFAGDFANFSRVAEQQGYRPKYGLPNDSLLALAKGSGAPDRNNIANAIAISASRDAEENTSGMKHTAGSARCSKVLGMDVYSMPGSPGNSCSLAWMFAAAVDNAPQMKREALAAGLQRAGSVEFSFPQGPNDFRKPRTTTAGQFWRPTQFKPACGCWQVIDPTFKRTYE